MFNKLLMSMVMTGSAFAGAVLKSDKLAVELDSKFPRVIQYKHTSGAVIEGQKKAVNEVLFNGENTSCRISFKRKSANSGSYFLNFDQKSVTAEIRVTVKNNHVEFRLGNVKENGSAKLKSFSFPGNALLTSSQQKADVAFVKSTTLNDDHHGVFNEEISTLDKLKTKKDSVNYFFLADGKLSTGLYSNHFFDIKRAAFEVSELNGKRTIKAQFPDWPYRHIESEKVEPLNFKVIITPDVNDDKKVNWQDAAVVQRELSPKPYGYELMREAVGENIAMNFASGGQQPFMKILDEVKKIYRATDGLGNHVTIKGFSAEGHDSANTDYSGHFNERAGGVKDLNVLLGEAPKYNAQIGYHINTSEVYPEAHRYNPKILQLPNGKPKNAWSWLDQAHYIDKEKDMVDGDIAASLKQMKKETPGVKFVYVDTYHTNGWPAWKLQKNLKDLGIAMYTEGSVSLDPWTTWSHWRAKDSDIMRFVWFSHRDNFDNLSILRGGRSDHNGFMGWQNKHSFPSFIQRTFRWTLPARYMQHFDLLTWEKGQKATFKNGLTAEKINNMVVVARDGDEVMSWEGDGGKARLFVPWNPVEASKIYLWDDFGSEYQWTLPKSWKTSGSVYVYRLTDLGREDEKELKVIDGKVKFKAQRSQPYVVVRKKSSQKPLQFGEFSKVKDSGFDSYDFKDWKKSSDKVTIENDGIRNARLIIRGEKKAKVSQVVKGLKPGQSYVTSVWVQVKGERKAKLIVTPLGKQKYKSFSNYVTKTNVRHGMPNDSRKGSNYQRMKVRFTLPSGVNAVKLELAVEAGNANTMVEFDDVRFEETVIPKAAKEHWFYEDFEDTALGGYGPFTCCFGERTHLSETNKPYTQDTINGRFSLKTRDGGRVVRTVPATLRFKPNTRYRLKCETLGTGNVKGRLVFESEGKIVSEAQIKPGRNQLTMEFKTGNDEFSFLSVFKDGGTHLVLDDIAIDEL